MIRQNPYYIQDNIRLDLRDGKGRYTTPSKAKFYYIYVDDVLVSTGTFARVSMPVEEKEIVVSIALEEVFEEAVEEELLRQEEVSFEPQPEEKVNLAEALYIDLLKIVAKEDPELFSELTGEIEKVEEEVETFEPEPVPKKVLAEELYRELLNLFAEEEPLLFEELTGELPPLKGAFEYEEKIFETWFLGGSKDESNRQFNNESANEIINFELDRPISVAGESPQALIDVIDKMIKPAIKKAFDERIQGLDLFLFTFVFTKLVEDDGLVEEVREYIGVQRADVKNWDQFEELIMSDLYDKIETNYSKYLERSLDNKISAVGFRLENLYDTATGDW